MGIILYNSTISDLPCKISIGSRTDSQVTVNSFCLCDCQKVKVKVLYNSTTQGTYTPTFTKPIPLLNIFSAVGPIPMHEPLKTTISDLPKCK